MAVSIVTPEQHILTSFFNCGVMPSRELTDAGRIDTSAVVAGQL